MVGPSADLTVHVLGESRSEWVLAHLRAHRAGEGYASGELALWDPEAGLVAFATQVMIFTFPEPLAPELLVPLRPTTRHTPGLTASPGGSRRRSARETWPV